MTDKQLLDAFLQFLEDHNYCKRTYCRDCQNWMHSPHANNNRRYCIHWKAITWASDWCSEAREKVKDYEMDSDK